MRKIKIGKRVKTKTHGDGVVTGYESEYSDSCMRYFIKLDKGKLWEGKEGAFFPYEVSAIEEEE